MERQNDAPVRQRAEEQLLLRSRQAAGKAEQWREGYEQVCQLYPDMDVSGAMRQPKMKKLLKAGLDFKTAFEAANLEEIKQHIALESEKRALWRMAENSGRIVENGVAASRSAPFTSSASGMSKEDRADIVKRVLRGEEIKL